MARTDVGGVDAYIAKQPAKAQGVLRRVRRIIRKVLPKAEETISYQIPTYKVGGQYVVYFAGWKEHWSLYPVTEPVRASLGSELAPFKLSKGTVRFPLADPVPAKLVARIVVELARAAEGRSGRSRGRAKATRTLDKSPDVAGRRERLVALCQGLPRATAERAGRDHLAFTVGKKIFAYYVYDHHGDGRIALLCKAPPGEQAQLVAEDPERYFVPPYVGSRGWVGLRVDSARIDWAAVKNLLSVAYFLTAPARL